MGTMATEDYSAIQSELDRMANSRNYGDAIKLACDKAPLKVKDQEVKDAFSKVVTSILNEVRKLPEIVPIMKSLSAAQVDNLMKYLYKGLSDCENGTTLLLWHQEATKKGGIGCIVRAISDRYTL